MALLFLLLLLEAVPNTSSAHALVHQPRETTLADHPDLSQGWTPKPTISPHLLKPNRNYASIEHNFLFARQDQNAKTCGYIDGKESLPVTCGSGDACAYYNTPSLGPRAFNCCPTAGAGSASIIISECPYIKACLNHGESGNTNSGSVNAIANNDQTLSCGTVLPSCYTIANSNTAQTTWYYYGCATTAGFYKAAGIATVTSDAKTSSKTSTKSSSKTSKGSTKSSSKDTTHTKPTQSTPPPISETTKTVTNTPSSPANSSPPSKSSDTSSTTTTASSNTPSLANSGSNNSDNKVNSNVAAIAGGTVGGIAVLALIATAIGYLVYRKRKQRIAPLPEISQYEPYGHHF